MEQERRNNKGTAEDRLARGIRYMVEHTYFDVETLIGSMTQDSSTSFVFFGDVQQDIYFISENMRERFGFSDNVVEGLLERWESRIYSEEEKRLYRTDMERLFRSRSCTHDLRYRVVDTEGLALWIRCYGTLRWSEDGRPVFFSGRISTQDNQYYIDPVSNLPGGGMLLRELEQLSPEDPKRPVIGFCMNHMEKINSLQGRTYGDRLLQDVSAELQSRLVRNWSIYRLDGMRFAAVAKRDGLDVDEEIHKLRAIVTDAYLRMGVPLERPCSFVAMEYPVEHLTPIDFQENLITMIRYAREHPECDYVQDDEKTIYRDQVIANSEILLYQNVKDGMVDFRPVVQPVVSARTGEIVGGETLLRWRNGGRDVPPDVFIPMLEHNSLIGPVGRWIFAEAVRLCSEIAAARPSFYLTVNISLRQLHDEGLVDYMSQVLDQYGLEGSHICVELTESCMDQEPEKLVRFVEGCEALGMSIALDDFGSGYSSMRVLMKYPSDLIKLDRSLLVEMTESEEKLNFIASIVYACHRFGKRVCIEGVETERQRKLSVDADCDLIQGYFYYRPLELSALREVLCLPPQSGENAG